MARHKDKPPERRPRGTASPEQATSNPRIEITPSPAQYRRLCEDLAALRAQGATSHTAAIVDAVHFAARRPILGAVPLKARPRRRSGTRGG